MPQDRDMPTGPGSIRDIFSAWILVLAVIGLIFVAQSF